MATVRTGEQVTQHYIDRMGEPLGELFNALYVEVTWMHWRWHQQVALFSKTAVRLELLNEVAPFFFHIVQRTLFEDTLLSIARLIGSSQSYKHENLAIERLIPLVREGVLRNQVGRRVAAAKAAGAFAIEWRNRHIAHRDLARALGGQRATPLPPVQREEIDTEIRALADLLNVIESHYCENATTAYDHATLPGDAESLLHVMLQGRLRQNEREAASDRGQLHAYDVNPPTSV